MNKFIQMLKEQKSKKIGTVVLKDMEAEKAQADVQPEPIEEKPKRGRKKKED